MDQQKKKSLLPVLGTGFGIAILVGNCVGIGILRMPGTIASYLTNDHLILSLWMIGGIISMLGAMIYAEASTACPKAGGPYVIVENALGKQAGFTVGLSDWIYNNASNAALSIAVAEYVVQLHLLNLPLPLLSGLLIAILTLVQWFGIQSSDKVQKALSLGKAIGLLFLVFAFLFWNKNANSIEGPYLKPISEISWIGAIVLSFRAILITYGGWNAPTYFAEENTNPEKNLPKALIYGVLSITVIYLLVNWSLQKVVPTQALANSPLAVAEGAKVVFGEWGKTIVTLVSIVIVSGALYAGLLFAPRIIFAKARSGLFFSFAGNINQFHIPGSALLLTSFITIIFALSGSFELVISMSLFLLIFIDSMVYLSALKQRLNKKQHLPYLAKLFPISHAFMILLNVSLLIAVIAEDWKSSGYAIVVILSSFPLYWLLKRNKKLTL